MFKLRLKNYRGFLNEEFDFSRINILIGENSSGKSSILKFLLAIKQSFAVPNNREYNLTLAGNETDLGNFHEIIYNHEIDRNLGFSFEFEDNYFDFFIKNFVPSPSNTHLKGETLEKYQNYVALRRDEVISHCGKIITSPTSIHFELSSDLSVHKNINTFIFNEDIGELTIIHRDDNDKKASEDIYLIGDNPECDILFSCFQSNKTYRFEQIGYDKQAFLSIIVSDDLREHIDALLPEEERDKIYSRIAFLLITQNYVQLQATSLEYINPILSEPAERLYFDRDRRSSKKATNIKELIDYLSTNSTKKFIDDFSSVLTDFGIVDSLHIQKDRNGFTRELRVVLNEFDSNIKDVGYGVSLQLPIIAQAMLSENKRRVKGTDELKKGDTLIIEQPEVHLHPRLQARFLEALLKIGRNNVFIIETHSEHIIRKLQVLIKEKKYGLSSKEVSINYLRKEGREMIKSEHKIEDETGKLIPGFPKGFFDVSYDLAFQLLD